MSIMLNSLKTFESVIFFFFYVMVSANLAESRVKQGKHGYLGGSAGDCKDARLFGARLGGRNNADRVDPGVRTP